MKKITIIGSGFAALSALKQIRKNDPVSAITIISPKAEFLYAPSLIWIPTGLRTAEDLNIPLNDFFKRMEVTHHPEEIMGIKDQGRIVITQTTEIHNDALIIASGTRFLKKIPGIENVITLCEGIKAAQDIQKRLHLMKSGTIAFGFAGNPEEKQAMRGGPMFELLFGIDTWLRRQKKRDHFTLKFFSPAPKPGFRLGEKAFKKIMQEMEKRNIEVASLGEKIKQFESNKIITEKTEIDADLILFMPGLTGPAWLKNTELPISPGGMVLADRYTRVQGFEKVYAIGDIASYEAPDWAPKQAHMADSQAMAAAENVLAELNNQVPFKTFQWQLICIIDTLNKGIFVFRNQKRKIVFSSIIFHWAKRFFEGRYLKQYKK